MLRTKMIATAVAGMALAFSSGVMADSITDYIHLELGAGVSWYSKQPDGTWYQQGMPHSLGMSAPVLMGGFTGPIWQRESWGIDWHVDYVYLAHASAECYCTSVDANYNTQAHQRVYTYPYQNLQPAKMVGNGNAQGISITIEPYYRYNGFRFGVEGGLFPYRPSWTEQVYNTQDNIMPNGQPVAPHNLTMETPHGIQLGEVVGVSIGRGPWSISYRHYFLPTRFDSQHSPSLLTGADVLTVRYRF
ncbi:hypothetical protein PWR63_23720 [Paraburkholderia sp. A2WS-5]|uniref:hypothetical protein n=1 Tax=Paraburkholderia sp. A2WS-5 TaxID=3028372 RepID=UPI003B7DFD1D